LDPTNSWIYKTLNINKCSSDLKLLLPPTPNIFLDMNLKLIALTGEPKELLPPSKIKDNVDLVGPFPLLEP